MGNLMERKTRDGLEYHVSTGKLSPSGEEHVAAWGNWVMDVPVGNVRYCQYSDCDLEDMEAWHKAFTFKIPAGENERFAEGCFDKQIGRKVKFPGHGELTVTSAEIVEDGDAAIITVEKPGDV